METTVKQPEIKVMPSQVFETLIAGLIYENDLSIISGQATHQNFKLSFYGEQENDYELTVEDFGYDNDGDWVQLEPTEDQFKTMRGKLKMKVMEDNELDKLENVTFPTDLYSFFGVSRGDFFGG